MPAVYVCLSAGVDNSKTEPRSCTHGERSAQRRLAKGLFLKKEIAAAITSLLQQGLLVDRAPADGVRKLRATTYEVSPDRTEDLLAVAHDFIGMQVFKDGKRRKRKLNPGVANLSGMLRTCSSLDTTISLDQSKTDMLQTFFCLLAKQDFKAHGGVDPRAVSGTFEDCKPGENPEAMIRYCKVIGSDGKVVTAPSATALQRMAIKAGLVVQEADWYMP